MRKSINLRFVTLFLLIMPCVLGTGQNYQIITTLDQRNIDKGDELNFSIDIIGTGKCDHGFIYILPEGKTNITEYNYYSSEFYDPNTLNKQKLINITPGYKLDNSCFGPIGLTKRIYIQLNITKVSEVNQFRVEGKLLAKDNSEGGDYKLNVLFNCQYSNESNYFRDENTFHIKYWLEEWQYLIQIVVPLITFLLGIIFEKLMIKCCHQKRCKK